MSAILLTPQDLDQLIKNEPTVIIDTRNPEAFATGHVPGAINMHDIFTFLAT